VDVVVCYGRHHVADFCVLGQHDDGESVEDEGDDEDEDDEEEQVLIFRPARA
jgi:Ran GTPase-activating protein (RanGAP) involved in mRNA processing and transport